MGRLVFLPLSLFLYRLFGFLFHAYFFVGEACDFFCLYNSGNQKEPGENYFYGIVE